MKIQLNAPHKIAALRYKRYETHYRIPAEKSLVVPRRALGDEVSCDVLWEDTDGQPQVLENIMFVNQNLLPVNDLADNILSDLWLKYNSMKQRVHQDQ